jgi:hypothetical protein
MGDNLWAGTADFGPCYSRHLSLTIMLVKKFFGSFFGKFQDCLRPRVTKLFATSKSLKKRLPRHFLAVVERVADLHRRPELYHYQFFSDGVPRFAGSAL